MEFQTIIDTQQERVNKVEGLRESLIKLRQEKRTRNRFEAAWKKIQQAYQDFLTGHNLLIRQNFPQELVYL